MEYVGLGVFAFAHAAARASVVCTFVRDAGVDLGWLGPGGDGGRGGGSDRDDGPQPPVVPPPDAGGTVAEATPATPDAPPSITDQLLSLSGVLVFALAGIVLVAGLGVAALMRRR